MKLKLLFALIVIMLAGSACTSYDRCMRKFGHTVIDTAIVTVEHIIPKDSVITHIHIDSIQYMIPGEVYEQKSERATIKYWKDKYSNLLMMQAECDTIILRDTIRVPYATQIFTPPDKKDKNKHNWVYALFGVLGIIGFIVIFKSITK